MGKAWGKGNDNGGEKKPGKGLRIYHAVMIVLDILIILFFLYVAFF
jgi:hypothetical protein